MDLVEKVKKLSEEDRAKLQDALKATDPNPQPEGLTVDELTEIRTLLGSLKEKKGKRKGILETLDSLFE